jgi:hypothetical protein
MNIYTLSAAQNDRLNIIFVKDIQVLSWQKWLEIVKKRPFISRKFWFTVST